MLTQEQRDAIQARMSGNQDEAPVQEEQPKAEATQEPVPEKPEETSEQTPREEDPAHPPTEKLVPLSEVVKLRGERRALKDNLSKLEREVAELRGFVQGSKTKPKEDDQSWIDELEATEDPKTPDELSDIREFIAEQRREQGRAMLNQVVAAVKEAVPNIDDGFLVDELANGRTPQQAVAKWQQYSAKFAPPPPAVTPAPQQRAVPPTVAKATSAGASNTKPTSWEGVSQAVRRQVSRK